MNTRKHQQTKEKKMTVLVVLGTILLFLLVLGLIFRFVVMDKVEDKVATEIIDTLIESDAVQNQDLGNGKTASEIYDSMSKDDQKELKSIINDNITPETISKGTEYVKNDDMSGLKAYAKENLSEEDFQKARDLYEKYYLQ